MAKVTLKDIAKKAGVSHQAVSLVLNKKDTMVGKDTRDKILKIAEELNYRPNILAQSLKSGKTNIIGITLSGLSTLSSYGNPYFSQIVSGAGDVLGRNNQKLLFHSYESKHSQTFQTRELADSRIVDGILVVLFSDHADHFMNDELPYLKEMNVPFVAISSLAEDLGCTSVGIDPVQAGHQATEHLIGHGYKEITGIFPAQAKGHYLGFKEGFCQAMQEAGLSAGIGTYEHSYTIAAPAMKSAANILDTGKLPRAYFTCNDDLARAMVMTLRQRGKRVPEDVALVDLSGQSGNKNTVSEITTVHQPTLKKGKLGAELLLKKLDDPDKVEEKTNVLETELVIRQSCGCKNQVDS